jgi:molybdate transport system substrate-binding protein
MKLQRNSARIRSIACAILVAASPLSSGEEVRLIAANAVREPVQEVVALFEKSTGHKVVPVWSGTEGVTRRVAGPEPFDVIIIAGPNIDKLVQEGRIVAGSRTDIARSGVGVAVRAGLPRPDISSADAVRQAVLAAKTVAYSSGPSGFYIAELFRKFGIADQVKEKVRQTPSGVLVGDLLARGDADLGFQQVSELQHVKGIDFLGPLPAEVQNFTIYSAGLHANAPAPEAARALMRLLASPQAAPLVRKSGMEPP